MDREQSNKAAAMRRHKVEERTERQKTQDYQEKIRKGAQNYTDDRKYRKIELGRLKNGTGGREYRNRPGIHGRTRGKQAGRKQRRRQVRENNIIEGVEFTTETGNSRRYRKIFTKNRSGR